VRPLVQTLIPQKRKKERRKEGKKEGKKEGRKEGRKKLLEPENRAVTELGSVP
jgi:flagellar biosynthesis/type III secretory pathway protein FliH